MTGLFKVMYFDPKGRCMNMVSYTVTASNAEEAIRKADKMKDAQRYRVQEVDCLGFSDE